MYILVNKGLGDAPSCTTTNCSAICSGVPEARFNKQPPDLQRVLTTSFKDKDPAGWLRNLDSENCLALASIFNRLCKYRVWCHVSRILKISAGEAPVLIADRIYKVPGRTPSVFFISRSGDALNKALMATGRFCTAKGAGASQHPGQTTLREISRPDSLHVSIGPGNNFDAHIDKYSPVTEHPGSTFCSNLPSVAALTHIGQELVPEIVPIPGVQVFPDFELTPTVPRPAPATRQEADLPPPPVGITWRGPVRGPRTQPRVHKQASRLLSAEVVTRINRAIKEQVSPNALVPSHAAQSEATSYPDAQELALDLAERMEQARRGNVTWVKIDLPQYGSGDFSSRRAIAGQIRRIALILRNYLPDHANDVRTIVIFFGLGNFATREEVNLP